MRGKNGLRHALHGIAALCCVNFFVAEAAGAPVDDSKTRPAGIADAAVRRWVFSDEAFSPLQLSGQTLTTPSGTQIRVADLPTVHAEEPIRLSGATPLAQKAWRIAYADVLSNWHGAYFGAGEGYPQLYERDISLSGILALNRLYPEKMLASLKKCAEEHHRLAEGWVVEPFYHVPEIQAPWILRERGSALMRRTDNVLWIWSAGDLFQKHPEMADWRWLFDEGKRSFRLFYDYMFDPLDGLYRGQQVFIDLPTYDWRKDEKRPASGYPPGWSFSDCVLAKSLSLNAAYFKALNTMADAAEKLDRPGDAAVWRNRADELGRAIVRTLEKPDGTFAVCKARDGSVVGNRDALGTAFAVLTGVLKRPEDARRALVGYPMHDWGIPLYEPFFSHWRTYHNRTSWPQVDTFFLWAKEMAEHRDHSALNAAYLIAYLARDGHYRELVRMQDKVPTGKTKMLWTASSFLNVGLRSMDLNDCQIRKQQ